MLFQVFPEESGNFVKGNSVGIVIEIRVAGILHNEKLLVVSGEFFEGVLAEIAAVSLFAVDNHDRASDFAAVRQNRHVHH